MRIRLRKSLIDIYHRILGYHPIEIDNSKFRCDPYHQEFWCLVNKSEWEPQTYKILNRYLEKDSVYCDIGAWIGPTVIYAAKKCKQAYCFEPDTVAYRFLLWNMELNNLKNLLPNNIALSNKNGIETIASLGSELGDSMTSMLGNKKSDSIDILCMKWDNWCTLVNPEKINFMKIDIEGAEFDFIPTLNNYFSEHMPVVYLSLHAPFLDKNIRKEKLQQIVDTMKIYKHCLNENFEEIKIDSLTSEENQENFNAFIFKN